MAERFDWQGAYLRLEKARQALDAVDQRSPGDVHAVLQARAETSARPEIAPPVLVDPLDLLVFRLAGEGYGIEAGHILEVMPLQGLTPVPSVPPVLLGILNHRGRILPVLDLQQLFGLSVYAASDAGHIVVMRVGEMCFGLRVDAVIGTTRVDVHTLASPQAREGSRQIPARGVTADMISVLDVQALANDPRIVINQDGG